MAWRDSFIIKKDLQRYSKDYAESDNSELLELERKLAQSKPSSDTGIFGGTYFEDTSANQASAYPKLKVDVLNVNEGIVEEQDFSNVEEKKLSTEDGDQQKEIKTRGHHRSLYSRATTVLDDIQERLSSSGSGLKRAGSREDVIDRNSSTVNSSEEQSTNRRLSTAPVRQLVSNIKNRVTRLKSKSGRGPQFPIPDDPNEEVPEETIHAAENPRYSHGKAEDKIDELKE